MLIREPSPIGRSMTTVLGWVGRGPPLGLGLVQALGRSESTLMSKDLTIEQAAEIIASAFAPLRCVASPWDGGYRLRFNVYSEANEPILSVDEMLKPQVADSRRLESNIHQARNNLAERGFMLAPWSFPSV